VNFAGRSMERGPIVNGVADAMCRFTTAGPACAPQRDLRFEKPAYSTPASMSASCYDTAISVKVSSRRAVHLSGSLEEHVRLQKVLGSATSGLDYAFSNAVNTSHAIRRPAIGARRAESRQSVQVRRQHRLGDVVHRLHFIYYGPAAKAFPTRAQRSMVLEWLH